MSEVVWTVTKLCHNVVDTFSRVS